MRQLDPRAILLPHVAVLLVARRKLARLILLDENFLGYEVQRLDIASGFKTQIVQINDGTPKPIVNYLIDDAKGRLSSKTDPRGVTVTYGYNQYDFVTSVVYTQGAETRTVTLGRDGNGNILNVADTALLASGFVYEYAFDELNRVTLEVNHLTGTQQTFRYKKNAGATTGVMDRMTFELPGAGAGVVYENTYAYNNLKQLTSFMGTGFGNVFWTPSPAGRIEARQFAGVFTNQYAYKPNGNLGSITPDVPVLPEVSIPEYNKVDNIIQKVVGTKTEKFGYDKVDRLTKVEESVDGSEFTTTESFDHDGLGNRTVGEGFDVWDYNSRNPAHCPRLASLVSSALRIYDRQTHVWWATGSSSVSHPKNGPNLGRVSVIGRQVPGRLGGASCEARSQSGRIEAWDSTSFSKASANAYCKSPPNTVRTTSVYSVRWLAG